MVDQLKWRYNGRSESRIGRQCLQKSKHEKHVIFKFIPCCKQSNQYLFHCFVHSLEIMFSNLFLQLFFFANYSSKIFAVLNFFPNSNVKLVLEHQDQHHPLLKAYVLMEDEEPGGSRRFEWMQTQTELLSHKNDSFFAILETNAHDFAT